MTVTRSRTAVVAFWLAAAAGWAVIVVGVTGVLRDSDATRPSDLVRWFTGLLLLHDLALVPLALTVGWLVGRVTPARARTPLLLGTAATALVVVLAWPLVRGFGEREANPTLLPLPYGRNVVIAVVLVWVIVGAVAMIGSRARIRQRTEEPDGET